ncbi:glycerophosphoryl diester phosphodiesterase [Brevibacterium sanguinis]|uniref:Glycerophosphoryl diester phosphodiesterase n=2 Tax=Brevibacterium TaxID=1696 RepID=A0A366IL00_9MICO|nr:MULTISPECIES: glycerophosphodiester phosphodiesterase [Brevibacterium]RBP64713.1 glycerophosphoryl diester phosphodiesterase [Brevibacterium sanguinis]RBP71644.1 glycerophosphoryl diester phosphodiesterase [Brevibacterium celere]
MNSQAEVIAHRGGRWPGMSENTAEAFAAAASAGVEWMETDVHASADGVLFAAHDEDLARIAGRPQRIGELTADELDTIDLVGGGRLPRMAELFSALPDARWNIDVKSARSIPATVRTIRRAGAEERVRLASFHSSTLRRLREALPGTATSAGTGEAVACVAALLSGLPAHPPADLDALQLPLRVRGVRVITPRLVARAHARGLLVHVWTVNDPADMRRLLAVGVDGIVTDEVALALSVLRASGE